MAKKRDLFEELIEKRDQWRKQMVQAGSVIKGSELAVEKNRIGNCKWYLHPSKEEYPLRTMFMWVQEIPPGSRSGRQQTHGGRMYYIMEGEGYTDIDGVKHEWEEGDIVLIPIKPYGSEHQHFNINKHKPVQMLVAEPNWSDIFGMDVGTGFEVIEASPDYVA